MDKQRRMLHGVRVLSINPKSLQNAITIDSQRLTLVEYAIARRMGQAEDWNAVGYFIEYICIDMLANRIGQGFCGHV